MLGPCCLGGVHPGPELAFVQAMLATCQNNLCYVGPCWGQDAPLLDVGLCWYQVGLGCTRVGAMLAHVGAKALKMSYLPRDLLQQQKHGNKKRKKNKRESMHEKQERQILKTELLKEMQCALHE